ncbi:TrbG/VirB9 family P-type conjugative transfer protein [Vibrio tubiashii]|uniref:Conjugal transfer protein n=1 Tax=Vibrio tubiashii ATCC 19109 TaxID=1051646 RepID=F9T6T9_9VIBR|nr:TrbG/VirB9 family P-type conjugative transfer protein [Vibrio tubiashii]AIW17502.1 hypothetical protein IX91_25945 [Vibrio tubiashii ATCC 19109]EGU54494.1 hypothetical protein VITU9109_02932 [Vibrio tubiashii ATCC 19109]EIF01273.1 hypothetical protein VT1337_24345 [Vibrio tubiashii NCIMB 1337 = ATCC 19106]
MKKTIVALVLSAMSSAALAYDCQGMNYQSGDVITVNTSSLLGTRIELPSSLVELPLVTNAQRWDVLGDVGSKHIMLAPINNEKGGESTMIFAFTKDGKAFDIRADRVLTNDKNDSCVIIGNRSKFSRASTYKQPLSENVAIPAPPKKEVVPTPKKKPVTVDTQKLVSKAMKDYQQQIFTNYKWKQSGSFFGENVLSDIYDDGRQTFIRLNKPNQRNVTVETILNGNATSQPVNVVGNNLISVYGVYTKFVIKVADVSVSVTR